MKQMLDVNPIELPPVLSYKDIQRIFGFSRTMTYALLNRPDVGAFTIGSRHFILTETFLEWINNQAKTNSQGGTHGNT